MDTKTTSTPATPIPVGQRAERITCLCFVNTLAMPGGTIAQQRCMGVTTIYFGEAYPLISLYSFIDGLACLFLRSDPRLNLKKNIWGRAHIWTPPISIPWLRPCRDVPEEARALDGRSSFSNRKYSPSESESANNICNSSSQYNFY